MRFTKFDQANVTLALIERILDNWQDDTHWLHYHHKDDARKRQQNEGFPDCPHHTGFFVTALIFLDKYKLVNTGWLGRGWGKRLELTHLVRHPRSGRENDPRKRWNRDQLTPILLPLAVTLRTGRSEKAYRRVRKSAPFWEFLQPHHTAHFARCLGHKVNFVWRFFADLFEIADTCLDIYKKKRADVYAEWPFSSIVKSVYRNVVALRANSNRLTRFNQRLIAKHLEPQRAFEGYFTRKHHHSDQPPPIHLVWEPILKEYYYDV